MIIKNDKITHHKSLCSRKTGSYNEVNLMPILDHLSEEIDDILGFQSFHNAWAVEIAYDLNRVLPKGYRALSHAQIGSREVDVRTDKSLTAAEEEKLMMCYQPADQPVTANAVFPTELKVFVLNLRHRRYRTVGVIEIVSAGNKDRPESRNSFIAKCNYLLSQEVSVIIIDILAFPFFNLHNQLLETLKVTEGRIRKVEETPLYCVSYCNLTLVNRNVASLCISWIGKSTT